MNEVQASANLPSLSDALESTALFIRSGPAQNVIRLAGLKGAARAFFIARSLDQDPRPALCLLPTDKDAEAFADDLRFFLERGERMRSESARSPRVR